MHSSNLIIFSELSMSALWRTAPWYKMASVWVDLKSFQTVRLECPQKVLMGISSTENCQSVLWLKCVFTWAPQCSQRILFVLGDTPFLIYLWGTYLVGVVGSFISFFWFSLKAGYEAGSQPGVWLSSHKWLSPQWCPCSATKMNPSRLKHSGWWPHFHSSSPDQRVNRVCISLSVFRADSFGV